MAIQMNIFVCLMKWISRKKIEDIPGNLTKESIEAKLKEAQERLARYESYQKLMEEQEYLSSITDADANS